MKRYCVITLKITIKNKLFYVRVHLPLIFFHIPLFWLSRTLLTQVIFNALQKLWMWVILNPPFSYSLNSMFLLVRSFFPLHAQKFYKKNIIKKHIHIMNQNSSVVGLVNYWTNKQNGSCTSCTWPIRKLTAYKQATRGPTALSPFRGIGQWG